ncbi:hypothetical protein ALI22I_07220 [Saccharothrix sp. ALI-22-I]|uniref:hypothetical protein n=1 Tax=Saccharothrix sp. ALI-22-I TaxID=1933778 RepID=UPI00097C4939|nr:hypothetical protein [Saccharothrix sp. ALI-22-I]ONI91854.1 hypothetical protein ALI22I_07220 [Saccharothrix sp. ALI-22-I]
MATTSGPRRPIAHTTSARQLRPAPAIVTAVHPPTDHSSAGYEIAAATPGGAPPTADPASLTPEFNDGPEGAQRMKAALRDATELAHPTRIERR